MESVDVIYARNRTIKAGSKRAVLDFHDDGINGILLGVGRRACPKCGRTMQKSGQKADSNGVIKQRFLCPSCKRKGNTPYNYFFRIDMAL